MRNLKPGDYWGGLVFDEMKIQVYWLNRALITICQTFIHVCANVRSIVRLSKYFKIDGELDWLSNYISYNQEDLQMVVRDGKHELVGMVEMGEFFNDMKTIQTGKYWLA